MTVIIVNNILTLALVLSNIVLLKQTTYIRLVNISHHLLLVIPDQTCSNDTSVCLVVFDAYEFCIVLKLFSLSICFYGSWAILCCVWTQCSCVHFITSVWFGDSALLDLVSQRMCKMLVEDGVLVPCVAAFFKSTVSVCTYHSCCLKYCILAFSLRKPGS